MTETSDPTARQSPHVMWAGVHHTLRSDVTAGVLLLAATVTALALANSPAAGLYARVRDYPIGPEALHLHLTVGAWAADGLLAIFFFVVGLELKEEFVVGKLRDPRAAALPIAAAVAGVAIPALVFVAVNRNGGGEVLQGWAIPTATDIAFAVAIIAVIGRSLPSAVRTFLLTLAIVDDLLAITIIATVYTDDLAFWPLLAAFVPLAVFALLVQRGTRAWFVLLPLAVLTWALIHASGIHATVAGVLLAFAVPVKATARARVLVGTDEDGHRVYDGLAAHFADRWEVISGAIAVPIFAFFATGVAVGGLAGLSESLSNTITLGIIAGLVVGKFVGVAGIVALLTRSRRFRLDPTIAWPDLIGISFVAGIGFTVALLVGDLSYGEASTAHTHVKVGVLVGSLLAACLGGAILGIRNRHYWRHGRAG
ncbi:MAG TPA: Na+/H+ antiporter NhaA [Propionibacteriaceae bacterium]|nr:Na+/H+ antiporter NhaA [Propionibacteriaceae bacterium]